MRITTIQARTQGIFEVEEGGLGALSGPQWVQGEGLMGGGGRRRSPRKLIDLSILHIYRVFFLVRNDPLFNYLSMSFTPQFMKYDSISTLLQYCSTLCSKSPSVRGFVVSLPVRLLFKYLPHNTFCPVSSLPQCDI